MIPPLHRSLGGKVQEASASLRGAAPRPGGIDKPGRDISHNKQFGELPGLLIVASVVNKLLLQHCGKSAGQTKPDNDIGNTDGVPTQADGVQEKGACRGFHTRPLFPQFKRSADFSLERPISLWGRTILRSDGRTLGVGVDTKTKSVLTLNKDVIG